MKSLVKTLLLAIFIASIAYENASSATTSTLSPSVIFDFSTGWPKEKLAASLRENGFEQIAVKEITKGFRSNYDNVYQYSPAYTKIFERGNYKVVYEYALSEDAVIFGYLDIYFPDKTELNKFQNTLLSTFENGISNFEFGYPRWLYYDIEGNVISYIFSSDGWASYSFIEDSNITNFLQKSVSKNSTPQDLSLFNVKGKVKSILYTSENAFPSCFREVNKAITFKKTGECDNIKNIFQSAQAAWLGSEIPLNSIAIKRNPFGQISNIMSNEELIYNSFSWNDGKLSEISSGFWEGESKAFVEYSGELVSKISSFGYDEGRWSKTEKTFSNFIFDEMGNWTQGTVTETIIWGEDGMSEIETIKETYKITRQILYYTEP